MSPVRVTAGRALYALRAGALVRIDADVPVVGAPSVTTLRVDGGGFITGMQVAPDGTTYCRADVGGCYRWDPVAAQWTQLLTGTGVPFAARDGYDTESIAVAPSNSSVVYAGVGGGTFGRILHSTNKGATWQGSAQQFDIQGNSDPDRYSTEHLAVHPTTPTTALFGGRGSQGLLRTTNGTNWTAVSPQPPAATDRYGITCVAYDPTDPTRFYAGVSGVGICLFNGASWSTVHSFTGGYPLEMVVTPTGTLWASFVATAPPWTNGLIRRTKAGVLTNIESGSQALYRHWRGIAVDPNNEARVVIVSSDVVAGNANQMVMRTTNATAATPTWADLAVTLNSGGAWVGDFPDQYTGQARLTAAGELWMSTGWGMWRAPNATGSTVAFDFTSKGIEERVAQVALKPAGHPLLTISWDMGIMRHPAGQLATRPHPYKQFASAWSLAVCPTNSSFLAAVLDPHPGASASASAHQSAYSTNGGATWTRFASLVAGTHPAELQFGNIAISANNVDNMIWAPANSDVAVPVNKIYYTTNRGASWQPSTVPAGYSINFEYSQRRQVAASHPTTAGTFYVVAHRLSDGKDDLLRSTDSGATWAVVPGLTSYNFRYGSKLKLTSTHLFAIPGHANSGDKPFWRAPLSNVAAMTTMTSLYNAHDIGFGAPLAGQTFPTMYSFGRKTTTGLDGLHYSTDNGASWTFIEQYVNNLYDFVTYVAGDPETSGKYWVGLVGNGFVEGTLSTTLLPVPGVPTIGTAVAGEGFVDVAFTPSNPVATYYTAALSTGQTNTGASSPIRVTAPAGVAVTGRVSGTTNGGTSALSAASNSVTPTAPAPPTNVLTYNFEDGTLQGWTSANLTGLASSTTTPITGTRTLRGTVTADGQAFFSRIGVPIPVGAASASVSIKYRQSAAREALFFGNSVPGYGYLDGGYIGPNTPNTVHTHTASLSWGAGTTTLDLYFRTDGAVAGDLLELDDVVITWTGV